MESTLNSRKKKVLSFFMAILVVVSYQLFEDCIIELALHLHMGALGTNPELWIYQNIYLVETVKCLILLAIYLAWYGRLIRDERYEIREQREKLPLGKTSLMMVVITFGTSGISLLWLSAVNYFLYNIPVLGNSLESFNETWSNTDQSPYIWVFLSVVIVGPVLEEVMFRGLAFHYLKRISPLWLPIIGSGVLFGIFHMELVQCVYTAVMGIVLAILYAKTKNLWVTIGIHVLNNFIGTLPPAWDTALAETVIDILCVVCIPPTVYLVIKYSRELNRWQRQQKALQA